MDGIIVLPSFDYHLDESHPDIVIPRRQDGSFAAAFSARGVTSEGIAEAAKRLYDKGVEQRLDRESGRYTVSRKVEKVAFWPVSGPRHHRLRDVSYSLERGALGSCRSGPSSCLYSPMCL
jgi:hypothetical protein